MSRISMARAIIVIPAALILAVTISAGARAALRAGVGGGGLAAAMLATGDLPAGSQPDASLTGPLTGERAQALGIDPSQLGSHDALVRAWLSPHRAEEVVETGADTWTRDDAQAGVAASASDLLKQGAVRQSLPGPARLDGYGGFVQGNGTRLFLLVLPLARGPYLFVLRVYTAASSAGSAGGLMSAVAAAAMRKVPADTPDTVSPGTFAADVARGAVGVLFAYLLVVDGIAYGRNPLRRKRGQGRSTRPQAGPGIIDVSAAAKKSKRTAVWRLAVQFIGLSLAAYGADAVGVHFWYAYLVAGLAIIWARRLVHPSRWCAPRPPSRDLGRDTPGAGHGDADGGRHDDPARAGGCRLRRPVPGVSAGKHGAARSRAGTDAGAECRRRSERRRVRPHRAGGDRLPRRPQARVDPGARADAPRPATAGAVPEVVRE